MLCPVILRDVKTVIDKLMLSARGRRAGYAPPPLPYAPPFNLITSTFQLHPFITRFPQAPQTILFSFTYSSFVSISLQYASSSR